ncbi:2-C-methyl-D-erythritol 4-phosphate cytidylyltransferase [Shewanella gaetbuli]|uniref:2-C-methyl-D-erythritol 4-phosphate cytidylyltransferase n=1 Tax=Shewanella gaetbuli TaxID=220752 RepID=A0A9X1ZLF4_9GAMM|nr:2-C-methyl-D-erythritol 4-phosphate cytidylyltransferase [Shewanella gaetbuli]MCL1141832.1 2-C-methyl-D-erythritol 4-phosphate cytidylyltransferase [Shewanella gaetbuli]
MTSSKSTFIAIVPAAGIGSRMQATIPKQYLQLGQQTILAHTLDCLLTHPAIKQVIVALHPQDEYFGTLSQASHPKITKVVGGGERADSVLAALQQADENAWALVHDAARPCLTHGDINKLITASERFPQGAILAAPVRDTMKRGNSDGTIGQTVDRENLWHALTPQLFPVATLKNHLTEALAEGALITDEASAMEWAGEQPGLVAGRVDNIKVTHPDDLQLAQLFLTQQSSQ